MWGNRITLKRIPTTRRNIECVGLLRKKITFVAFVCFTVGQYSQFHCYCEEWDFQESVFLQHDCGKQRERNGIIASVIQHGWHASGLRLQYCGILLTRLKVNYLELEVRLRVERLNGCGTVHLGWRARSVYGVCSRRIRTRARICGDLEARASISSRCLSRFSAACCKRKASRYIFSASRVACNTPSTISFSSRRLSCEFSCECDHFLRRPPLSRSGGIGRDRERVILFRGAGVIIVWAAEVGWFFALGAMARFGIILRTCVAIFRITILPPCCLVAALCASGWSWCTGDDAWLCGGEECVLLGDDTNESSEMVGFRFLAFALDESDKWSGCRGGDIDKRCDRRRGDKDPLPALRGLGGRRGETGTRGSVSSATSGVAVLVIEGDVTCSICSKLERGACVYAVPCPRAMLHSYAYLGFPNWDYKLCRLRSRLRCQAT